MLAYSHNRAEDLTATRWGSYRRRDGKLSVSANTSSIDTPRWHSHPPTTPLYTTSCQPHHETRHFPTNPMRTWFSTDHPPRISTLFGTTPMFPVRSGDSNPYHVSGYFLGIATWLGDEPQTPKRAARHHPTVFHSPDVPPPLSANTIVPDPLRRRLTYRELREDPPIEGGSDTTRAEAAPQHSDPPYDPTSSQV
ncbi:hypothetical protein BJ165DRAFT_1616524 [Panaeolus papilionaceus]|nr:hypothetical protein BJ165DRAFT_1616524 [Panaeolus papilionaceus]